MSDSITVAATSTRVAHTFRVDFKGKYRQLNVVAEGVLSNTGLDEVEQTLKSTGGVGRSLTKYWRFSIKIIQEVGTCENVLIFKCSPKQNSLVAKQKRLRNHRSRGRFQSTSQRCLHITNTTICAIYGFGSLSGD